MSKKFGLLYDTLNPDSKKNFQKWLFNTYSKHSDLLKYFEIIQQNEYNHSTIYDIIYPNTPFNDKKIRYLSSNLYQALKAYLSSQIPETYQHLFITEAAVYAPTAIFDEAQQDLYDKIETLPLNTEHYFLESLSLQMQYKHAVLTGVRDDGKYAIIMLQNLEKYYIAEKLRLSCIIINNEQVFKYATAGSSISDDFLDIAKEVNEVTAFYAKLYLLITTNQVKIIEIVTLLERILSQFDIWMSKEIFVILQNYCIKHLKTGDKDAETILFFLYKLQIESSLLLTNNTLSPWTFKNIVTIAFRLKEDEWAYQFMHAYKNYIPKGEQENVYNYNLANYYNRKKNYDKSLALLQGVNFTDTFYKIGSKWMISKIYFEKKEWLSLEYALQSFKQLLKREKSLNDDQKLPYYNQIKHAALLAKAYQQSISIQKINTIFHSNVPLAEAVWLQEQLQKYMITRPKRGQKAITS